MHVSVNDLGHGEEHVNEQRHVLVVACANGNDHDYKGFGSIPVDLHHCVLSLFRFEITYFIVLNHRTIVKWVQEDKEDPE